MPCARPPTNLLERRAHDANQMSAVLLAQITLDLPAVLRHRLWIFTIHFHTTSPAMTRSIRPPTRTSNAPVSSIPSATPSIRPDGVPNSTPPLRERRRQHPPILENAKRHAFLETRQTGAQRCKRLRKNRPRVDVAPELRFDRRRPISQFRRIRRRPEVDAKAEDDVDEAFGARRCFSKDARQLARSGWSRTVGHDDVVRPLDLNWQPGRTRDPLAPPPHRRRASETEPRSALRTMSET